jgi:S-disulfanyl-L-cysteine oxidoreductase SoxD
MVGDGHDPPVVGAGGPPGHVPSEVEFNARDIAVGPDGEGLHPTHGTVAASDDVYQAKCVGCHGSTGSEGARDKLVGEGGEVD